MSFPWSLIVVKRLWFFGKTLVVWNGERDIDGKAIGIDFSPESISKLSGVGVNCGGACCALQAKVVH